MRSGRRAALVVLAATLAILAAVRFARLPPAPGPPSAPSDVLLITIDTLRADHLGSYGGARGTTLALDSFAQEGTRFAHVVAPAPLTLPSHASIFSGLTPLAHGVRDNAGFAVPPSVPLLAERFRAAGYATAAFVSGAPLQQAFGLARGFDHYDDRMTRGGDAARPLAVERPANETVTAVADWLSHEASVRERALFLWVHLFDPHAPYDAPEPYRTAYRDRPYVAEIAFVDEQFDELRKLVASARGNRRSISVVTADHGEGLGDHDEPTHGLFVYDSTIRVPLIIAGEGLPQGRVVDSMVRLIDVAPTLLDLAGLPPFETADGASLRPAMTTTSAVQAPAYVESLFGRLCCGWAPLHAWRDDRWVFIDAPRAELYDMAADPGQRQNVAPDHPQEIARLRRALVAAMEHARSTDASSRGVPSSDTRAQLRSLGYLGGGQAEKPSLRDPKDMIQLSTRLGEILETEDADAARAARDLREVLEGDPQNPLARRHLGKALLRQQRFAEAASMLNALASEGDDSNETLALLAEVALERGDWKAARAHLEAVSARDPADTGIAFRLAVVLLRSGERERALPLLERVVAREPGNVDALIDLGGVLLEMRRPADAAVNFQRAIDAGADAPLAWNGLGFAKREIGDAAGAAEAWRRSLRVDPNQPAIKAAVEQLGRNP
jgi:choline-sulfatase